tara:strand:- start:1082 stop:1222 length:141 start_codon:yes stop_codon:yes gene_type:complete
LIQVFVLQASLANDRIRESYPQVNTALELSFASLTMVGFHRLLLLC